MRDNDPDFLNIPLSDAGDRRSLAYRRRMATKPTGETAEPGVVWLGGFKSDMQSSKALALDQWAAERDRAFLRFDYTGHGRSSGAFEEGCISLWTDDALQAIRTLTEGPQILVGSSMGGWIALLVARALAEGGDASRIAGMVLIAPAVDFTEALMWTRFTPEIRQTVETQGVWQMPSAYSPDPTPITRRLIEDGRNNLLLGSEIRAHGPVHILQGMQDPDVPWQHAMLLVEHLAHDPVSVTLVKHGDHRLSSEADLSRLIRAVEGLA